MISVMVNGEQSTVPNSGVARIADLIELIKTTIDPEQMIVNILIDGRDLEEQDWSANPNQYETAILEVETDLIENYVASRLQKAPAIIGQCYTEFRSARKGFQSGDMAAGNRQMIEAVNALKAFFEWYGTLLQLVPDERKTKLDITTNIEDIADTCKKICQQQLYQSWWALGETIEKELEPKLDRFEDEIRVAIRQ